MSARRDFIPLLRTWAVRREPWLILLVLVAVCYYGSYYRHGINFRDEGGTVALVAKRLLEGERPMRDVALGYNVMWFYPVVGLFKVFGVNFVLLRAYCFALSTLAAVLGFLVVERVSRRPWFAFLVGLLLVVVPGMTFKNYMPLLVVANAWCLTCFLLPRRKPDALGESIEPIEGVPPIRWGWLAFSSVVLALTYLIRIDLGIFSSVLWLGAVVLRALIPGEIPGRRISLLVGGPLLIAAIVWAVHLPVYLDAKNRGFDQQFTFQYTAWRQEIMKAVQQRFGGGKNFVPHVSAADPEPETKVARADKAKPTAPENREVLKRKTWRDMFDAKKSSERWLAPLLYAPLVSIVPLALWAVWQLSIAWKRRETGHFTRAAAALLLLGSALTAFPQYFFFRPDAPHLSEFSPGFWVAVSCSLLLLASSFAPRRRWPVLAVVLGAWLVLHASAFLWRMYPDRWVGTIAARWKRNEMLHAKNGVDVYLSKSEWTGLHSLLSIIENHSKPDDYLVAYPYHPAVNLAADRRTYEKNVYIDNAIRPPKWDAQAIARFEKYKPAVIVLSDWAINDTEASRFSNWAQKTKTWIQTNYIYQGTYLEFEVYTRPKTPLVPVLPAEPAPATPPAEAASAAAPAQPAQ